MTSVPQASNKMRSAMSTRRLLTVFAHLRASRRGNVMMIAAFALIPLTFAVGMGVDYSRAARLQTKLNALADAAALAAVTKPMMSQTPTAAGTASYNMWYQQAAGSEGMLTSYAKTRSTSSSTTSYTSDDGTFKVTITDTNTNGLNRTATVTWHAASKNRLASILGMASIEIGGTAAATSKQAPNIDFYMMLDTSPSMLLPATSAGLNQMTAATNGCAFACHQTSTTSSDPGGTQKVNGVYQDYYAVARSLTPTVQLRTDLVSDAVSNLTTVATATSANNGAVYRMGLADFDYMYRQLWPTIPISGFNVDSDLARVKTHVTDAQVLAYCRNNQRICNTGDNDTGTNFTAAFTGALATLPLAPGNGTNVVGDTPQAILFLITDGMRDELSGTSRIMGPVPTSLCDSIKARGVRIAVLYTKYLPESASDSWSVNNVKTPYLTPPDKISPALQTCASSGLYYEVTTDDDISAALAALFNKAIATARLSQ